MLHKQKIGLFKKIAGGRNINEISLSHKQLDLLIRN